MVNSTPRAPALGPTLADRLDRSATEGFDIYYRCWSTYRGVVNDDLHSDNPTTRAYQRYGKGVGPDTHEGTFVAAFDGMHGWCWRNRTKEDVTITLTTKGDYQEIKELP